MIGPDIAATRTLWLVSLTLFLSMVGFGLTLPALPFFVERLALGVDPSPGRVTFHVGMLTSAYALSQVVLGPLIGRWADRFGRKPLLLLGLAAFGVAQAVFGLGSSLPILYSARLAAGAGAAAMVTVSGAVVADVLPERAWGRGLAWTGTAASLGLVVGPAMSGLLSRGGMHGHRMVGSFMLDGFSIPFLAAAALAVLSVPLVFFFLDETAYARRSEANAGGPQARMTAVLSLTAASQVILSSFEAIFALYGASVLGWGVRRIGWGFVVCGGVMALQGGIVGLLAERVSRSRQIATGFAVLGIGTALLSVTESLPAVLGAIGVQALGFSLLAPNLAAEVARLRPDALGSALGIQSTAAGVGRVIGPVIGSLLFTIRPRLPFFLTSALAFAVALAVARSLPSSQPGR
jgi:MFS family permease